ARAHRRVDLQDWEPVRPVRRNRGLPLDADRLRGMTGGELLQQMFRAERAPGLGARGVIAQQSFERLQFIRGRRRESAPGCGSICSSYGGGLAIMEITGKGSLPGLALGQHSGSVLVRWIDGQDFTAEFSGGLRVLVVQ